MRADCHMHMVLDGYDWKSAIARHQTAPREDFIRSALQVYREQGCTYLRDCGDKWGVGAAARALAPEYGITYRTPLSPLCKAGHYGGFIGTAFETFADFARLVVHIRESGGDFVKIMISGLMDFNRFGVLTEAGLPAGEIRELVHIAKQEGMSVAVHANGADTVTAAAEAGVDSVEHGAYLDKNALQAMADFGVVWVPTLSTVGNLLDKGRFPDDQVAKILDSALQNVADFAAMGGHLAAGTDAGAWSVPHGSATEEGYFAKAGVGQAILDKGLAVIRKKF